MDKAKCVMCNTEIDLSKRQDYEYVDDGEIWCDGCFQRESDTGEIY